MKRRILIGNGKMHGDGGSLFAMATIASDARQARTTGWSPRKSAPRRRRVYVPCCASASRSRHGGRGRYEPVWAIGSGKTPTPAEVAETTRHIAAQVGDVPILYVGSATPLTCEPLLADGGIDGFLVGGASLSPVSFGSMIASLDQAGPLVSDQCSIRLQSKRRTEWNSAVRSMKESDDDV